MVLSGRSEELTFPFESSHIPERFLKKAEQELKETNENRQNGLEQLRHLVLSEPDLACRTTDDFLIQFLRARKYNIPKSFKLLKKYVNFKRMNGQIFTGMEYDNIIKVMSSKVVRWLPYRDKDGCAILAAHLYNWSPSESPIEELIRTIALLLYHSINDPVSQINGYKIIFDVKCQMRHIRHITPNNLYLLYNGTQECFPGRFKGIHIINMGLAFKIGWAFVYPFLSEKLKKRIHFYQNYDGLKKQFPDTLLPVDFGGQLRDEDNTEWLKTALQPENLEKLAN